MNKWFVDNRETTRIELDDGEWIDIKRHLSISDQDFLARETIDMQLDVDTNTDEDNETENVPRLNKRSVRRRQVKSEGRIKTARMMPAVLPLLKALIVDWSFCDNTGKKIPINDINVGNLRREIANLVQDGWMSTESPLGENISLS